MNIRKLNRVVFESRHGEECVILPNRSDYEGWQFFLAFSHVTRQWDLIVAIDQHDSTMYSGTFQLYTVEHVPGKTISSYWCPVSWGRLRQSRLAEFFEERVKDVTSPYTEIKRVEPIIRSSLGERLALATLLSQYARNIM